MWDFDRKFCPKTSGLSQIPGPSMRTVALLSGGKDSCFNMLKCVEAGHEIVALANLRPGTARAWLSSAPPAGP